MNLPESMVYEILIEDERLWRKDCANIPRKTLVNILKKIRSLAKDPWLENVHIKKLNNSHLADFRLRVGEYRVLFNRSDDRKVLHVLRVLHRSKLY